MLTLKEFKEARGVLSGVIRNTSLVYSPAFSKATGNQIYIKPENMQVTGAYKIRGAYYKDRKSTRLNSSHEIPSRMPSSA